MIQLVAICNLFPLEITEVPIVHCKLSILLRPQVQSTEFGWAISCLFYSLWKKVEVKTFEKIGIYQRKRVDENRIIYLTEMDGMKSMQRNKSTMHDRKSLFQMEQLKRPRN